MVWPIPGFLPSSPPFILHSTTTLVVLHFIFQKVNSSAQKPSVPPSVPPSTPAWAPLSGFSIRPHPLLLNSHSSLYFCQSIQHLSWGYLSAYPFSHPFSTWKSCPFCKARWNFPFSATWPSCLPLPSVISPALTTFRAKQSESLAHSSFTLAGLTSLVALLALWEPKATQAFLVAVSTGLGVQQVLSQLGNKTAQALHTLTRQQLLRIRRGTC